MSGERIDVWYPHSVRVSEGVSADSDGDPVVFVRFCASPGGRQVAYGLNLAQAKAVAAELDMLAAVATRKRRTD